MNSRYSLCLAACIVLMPLLVLMTGCESDAIEPGPVDTSYFPLEVGSYIIYELDSTVYDDFNMIVTERSLLVREIVESTFTGAGGEEQYRIERQYRENESQVWGAAGYDIWAADLQGNNAERIEENQRYIRIAFPARQGKTWNGNIHIDVDPDGDLAYLEGWEYRISAVDIPAAYNGMSFDSTMTVIEHAEGTLIDTVGSRSVYAKGIGLVARELWVLESQCTTCPPDWEEKAERGFIVRQTILDYGVL